MQNLFSESKIYKTRKKTKEGIEVVTEYFNIAAGMDTETTSTYNDQEEKVAIMYCHQWKIEDVFFMGRTWDDFREYMDDLREVFKLGENRRIVIYVHNLSFEFQFMRKEIQIDSVFATNDRTPIKVVSNGIEFRDSYILSQKSLEKLGEQVGVAKLKEDMNYKLVRTPITPLTEEEIQYCHNDVEILVQYIRQKIKEDGNITKIQLTNTGYVRKFIRDNCYQKYYREYKKLMEMLTITPHEYLMLKDAFQGGFTHANANYVGKLIEEPMKSIDFTSSYPAVMLSEKYPMSRARKCTTKTIEGIHKLEEQGYLMLVDITLEYIGRKQVAPDAIISKSKCSEISSSSMINNGRVDFSDHLRTTITNIDLEMIEKYYDFDSYEIHEITAYKSGYLPKPIVESVWSLYKDKTELKDVVGMEVEYMLKKGMVNASFGMIVTDIVRADILYDEEWFKSEGDVEEQIDTYNKNKKRFLFYPWGVFVTAYARRNLLNGILECGDDYVYSDTDSIKMLHPERHMKYIEEYNKQVTDKIRECFKWHKMEYVAPEDIYGKKHPLGEWDDDGDYVKFKTLGAKRYCYEKTNGKIGFTVAGIPKKAGIKHLTKDGQFDFNQFDYNLTIPKDRSEKLVHTYIDEEKTGVLIDYLGNTYEYDVKSSVHLEDTTASITLSNSFEKYLLGLELYRDI